MGSRVCEPSFWDLRTIVLVGNVALRRVRSGQPTPWPSAAAMVGDESSKRKRECGCGNSKATQMCHATYSPAARRGREPNGQAAALIRDGKQLITEPVKAVGRRFSLSILK